MLSVTISMKRNNMAEMYTGVPTESEIDSLWSPAGGYVVEAPKVSPFSVNEIRNQTAEEIDKGFTYVEERKASAFKIFHDDFNVPVHLDSLTVVFARSGHGKSTFANHVAAKMIMQKRMVAVFSNELDIYSYLYAISTIIGRIKGIADLRKVAEDAVKYVRIYDTTTSMSVTTCWDSVADYVVEQSQHFGAELTLFDQLSNTGNTYNPENSKTLNIKDPFKQIKFITTRFQILCNQRLKLAPIVTFQQGYSPDVKKHPRTWDAYSVARNGKGAIEDATHVLIIGRVDNYTIIKCDKFRYPGIPYTAVSAFKYESSRERFENEEVPDDWSKFGKKQEELDVEADKKEKKNGRK